MIAARRRPLRAIGVAGGLAVLSIALEWARVLGMQTLGIGAGVAGGLALCLLARGWSRAELGLGGGRLLPRVIGAAALTAVLLLPAAVRWTGQPPLGGPVAVMAVVIAVGEEIAFRGALFAAVREVAGPAAAVLMTDAAWTAAHALSHPPAFLAAVAGAGLVLGLWRWYADDLVAPIAAHVLADLAL